MTIDEHVTAIDTDFINHVTEMDVPTVRMLEVFQAVFASLGIQAVIHPLAYQHELLKENERINAIFAQALIGIPELNDIFQGEEDRQTFYLYLIEEFYKVLNNQDELPAEIDWFTYWKRKKSLGEIHAVAMCLVCGCSMFLSDDRDSQRLKKLVDDRQLGIISVYKREEVMQQYIAAGGDELTRKERRSFAHKIKSEFEEI